MVDLVSGFDYHIRDRQLTREQAMGKGTKKTKTNKTGSRQQIFTEVIGEIISTLIDIVVSFYIFLIIVVLPLYFQSGFEHIGSDKSFIFRQISFKIGIFAYILLFLFILVKLAENRHGISLKSIKRWNFSVTDLFAFVYAAGVVISYFCTAYRDEALLGTEKWYMGTLPQLAFVSAYFFISRFWKKHIWIPALVLPVSGVIFLLGLVNRFGIFPIDMKIYSPAFISTIGNINWYCGYVVTVLFAGISLWWLSGSMKKLQNVFLIVYTAVGLATLVTQGSDSGLFTLAFILIIMFCLSSHWENMMRLAEVSCILSVVCILTGLISKYTPLKEAFEQNIIEYPSVKIVTGSMITVIMTVMSFAFLIIVTLCKSKYSRRKHYYNKADNAEALKWLRKAVGGIAVLGVAAMVTFIAVNTVKGGSLTAGMGSAADSLFNFTIDWGSGRGASFRVAVWSFAEQDFLHKLVGVGPDCMSAYIYGDGSERILNVVTEKFGQLRLTNAHNEWLTILVNQGIVGAIAFAGMICSAIYRYIKKRGTNVIIAACGMGVLAYTLNNIFSFQTSVNTPTMFILLGVGECYIRDLSKTDLS